MAIEQDEIVEQTLPSGGHLGTAARLPKYKVSIKFFLQFFKFSLSGKAFKVNPNLKSHEARLKM